MDDAQSSFFGRFYNCVNTSLLQSKNVNNNTCGPNKKSFVASLFESKPKEPKEPNCDNDSKAAKDDAIDKEEPCVIGKAQQPYRDNKYESLPDTVCYIKEQNPFDPCCCELRNPEDEEDDGAPCPPAGYPQNPRASGCGCDLCHKSGYHGGCCNGRAYVQGSAEDPPQFEQA